jgi:hypothetical protein
LHVPAPADAVRPPPQRVRLQRRGVDSPQRKVHLLAIGHIRRGARRPTVCTVGPWRFDPGRPY